MHNVSLPQESNSQARKCKELKTQNKNGKLKISVEFWEQLGTLRELRFWMNLHRTGNMIAESLSMISEKFGKGANSQGNVKHFSIFKRERMCIWVNLFLTSDFQITDTDSPHKYVL